MCVDSDKEVTVSPDRDITHQRFVGSIGYDGDLDEAHVPSHHVDLRGAF